MMPWNRDQVKSSEYAQELLLVARAEHLYPNVRPLQMLEYYTIKCFLSFIVGTQSKNGIMWALWVLVRKLQVNKARVFWAQLQNVKF